MSDRDEIYDIARSVIDGEVGILVNGSDIDNTADSLSYAILAAGYRKPRIISTAEELDGLACGSVFRDDNERIWEVEKIGYGGVEKALSAMGIGSMIAFTSYRDFPATVLHEPTA